MVGFTVHRDSRTGALRAVPKPVVQPVAAGAHTPCCRDHGVRHRPHGPPRRDTARQGWLPDARAGRADMKHNLTLVILTLEQIARAREGNGCWQRIAHALDGGPYGQMFETEQECRKYFTLWDPDHRIEVAPGKFQALFADLFDRAVKTTAYGIVVDGVFGAATEAGIKAFRRDRRLSVNGTVDATAFARLSAPMVRALITPKRVSKNLGAAVVHFARRHLAPHPREIGGQNRGPWVRSVTASVSGALRAVKRFRTIRAMTSSTR